MKHYMKGIAAFILGCVVLIQASVIIGAETLPYTSYTYDRTGNALAAPAPYIPYKCIDAKIMGVTALNEPMDLCYSGKGILYVLDTGNNRILELDKDYKLIREATAFIYNDGEITLKSPGGMTVDSDNNLYIADSGNGRIIKMDADFRVLEVFNTPESVLFPKDFIYSPQKIAVDKSKKMFVISTGVNQGLMEFNADGKFMGFLGAPKVTFNFSDYLWKQFATKEQKARSIKFVPTEFSNVIVDSDGFLYGIVSTINTMLQGHAFYTGNRSEQNPVKRFNATGKDILVRNGVVPTYGDLVYTNTEGTIRGASNIVDVTVDENGIYSMLDSTRGRIFTYDADGNLMYVFGGLGNQLGVFTSPIAIERINDQLLVLDKRNGEITIFERTKYGKSLHAAIELYNRGEYASSVEKWKEVLIHNSNYQPAHIGIGKNYLRNDDYANAIKYLRMGNEKLYQSKAYGYYRDELMYKNIHIVFIVITLLAAFGILLHIQKKRRVRSGGVIDRYPSTFLGNIRYSLYIMIHPFKGFWDLKHEREKTLLPGILLVCLLSLSFITNSLYRGVFFNPVLPESYNVFNDILKAFVPVVLWCVSTWCFTSLMDGKGSFRDIITATSYSLTPMVVIYIPLTILSNYMVLSEGAYYNFFITLASTWTIGLVIIGTMITNDYSMRKTILTCILSIVGMGILIFLGLAVYSVIQQVAGFAISIYSEIAFRL